MHIIRQDKAIIEEEARVAFVSIGVEYLRAGRNVLQRLHHKTSRVIAVEPTCLLRQSMIQHVRHRNKGVRLSLVDNNPEYSGADY